MFGFFKTQPKPCCDMDLYGYLAQGVGGLINTVKDTGGRFSEQDILKRVEFYLNQTNKSLDQRQESLIKFAAGFVAENYYLSDGGLYKIKPHCDRFAEMMGNFDFADPSFKGLQIDLARAGCFFA